MHQTYIYRYIPVRTRVVVFIKQSAGFEDDDTGSPSCAELKLSTRVHVRVHVYHRSLPATLPVHVYETARAAAAWRSDYDYRYVLLKGLLVRSCISCPAFFYYVAAGAYSSTRVVWGEYTCTSTRTRVPWYTCTYVRTYM